MKCPPCTSVCFAFTLIWGDLAHAQVDTTHRDKRTTISGTVRDSIGGGFVVGANIQLVARDDPALFLRTARSDSVGHFMLGDIPRGRYRLGFFHPVLDSLGVESPLRDVDVSSDDPVIADLAIPSASRLRPAICRTDAAADGSGVIVGSVRSAVDGSPSARATVTGEWIELALNRLGSARRVARRSATTADNGWFALCDVPRSGSVALFAISGADSTGVIELQMPADGFARRELYIGPSLTQPAVEPRSGSARTTDNSRIRTGSGRLSGTVVSAAANLPLSGVQVGIVGGPQTRTNEQGEWAISNAPSGTRMLEIRALGYYPVQRSVDVLSGAQPLRIALSTFKAVLDTVKIIARRNPAGPDDGGFLERRKSGMGKYITVADMARFPVINTSEVFRRIPRVQLGQKIQMRGAFPSTFGGDNWCNAAIFINGHNMSFMSVEDIDDWVAPHEVAGIEVYPDGTVPPQFQPGLSGCGSVVIWTK